MDDKKERKIISWDDAGFWMHTKDTIEKITEDAIKLAEDHKEALNAPDLMWTSAYSALRKLQIENMYLIALIQLCSRMKALSRN